MKKILWKCHAGPNLVPMLLAASLLLGGCGGGRAAETTSAQFSVSNEAGIAGIGIDAVAETAAETAAAAYDSGGGRLEYNEASFDMEAPMEAPGGLADSSSITQPAIAGRKLIRNVSMSVETDAFDDLLRQLQAKVTELSGYIEFSDVSGSSMSWDSLPGRRYASITARIPSDKLNQFIETVEANGNVTNKSESTKDVTLQYSDLESRKKTLSVEQDRIWALLEKADTLEAVIVLEERLSEIRYELESMESQLKLFDNQVEYSTIDVSICEVTPRNFTPTTPETVGQRIRKGFSKNVTAVCDTITDLFVSIISGSPIWVPCMAVVILIFILAWRFGKKWKIGKKKRKEKTVPDSSGQNITPKDQDEQDKGV